MMTSSAPLRRPSFFSTVNARPVAHELVQTVRSLNMVVLPQFGLPARAILMAILVPSFKS